MGRYRSILKPNIKSNTAYQTQQTETTQVKINEKLWDRVFHNAEGLQKSKKYREILEMLKMLRRKGANVERRRNMIKMTQGNIETSKWEEFKKILRESPPELKQSINFIFALSAVGEVIDDEEKTEKIKKAFEEKDRQMFLEQQKQMRKRKTKDIIPEGQESLL